MSFKFYDNHLLEIVNFQGGATSLDSFWKAYRTSETKSIFPYEWFDNPDKQLNTELPANDGFYSKFRSKKPLEAEYMDYANLLESGLNTEQAVFKMKLSKSGPLLGLRNEFTCNNYGSKNK